MEEDVGIHLLFLRKCWRLTFYFCQPWSRWRTRWLWGWDWPKRSQSIFHRGEVGPRIIPPLSHKDEIKLSCFRRKFKNFHSRAQPASWQVGNGDGKVKVTVMVKEPSSMQDWGIAELVDEDYDIMQRTSWQGLWKTSLAWSRLNSSPASSSFTPGLPWVKWIDDSSEVFSDYMYIQKLTWAFLLGKVILTTSITSVSVRATWKFYRCAIYNLSKI